jgi:hypothetical protein
MKLTAFVLAFVFSGATHAGTATTATATTPTESCTKLVEAAKENKFEDFMALTTKYEGHRGPAAVESKKFSKVHASFMDKIKGITCGAEHVGGNNAFVEAAAGGETRFIPFINVNGTWKFDAKTYMTFYTTGATKHEKGM